MVKGKGATGGNKPGRREVQVEDEIDDELEVIRRFPLHSNNLFFARGISSEALASPSFFSSPSSSRISFHLFFSSFLFLSPQRRVGREMILMAIKTAPKRAPAGASRYTLRPCVCTSF